MRRTDTIEMGDADQHPEVGVQLFLQSGAWQAWLLAASGFKPLADGLVHLGDVPMSPIVQGCLSLCAELLKPAVGGRSTDLNRGLAGRFPAWERPACMRSITCLFAFHRCSLSMRGSSLISDAG